MNQSRFRRFRRQLLAAALTATIGLVTPFAARAAADDILRIGYQKSSGILIILKGRGVLEQVLAPLGVTVQWSEFTSGLPLLEGLNVGSIDLSADVAEPVPLFAQAAGANLTYLVQETPSPEGQAIVVPAESPIRSVTDLKGKKVALAKAAGVHYLLLKSLDKAGLQFKDVEAAYLQPADGRAAFEKGAVDAWAIWEPHLSKLQSSRQVRVVADGRYADVGYRRFYLTSTAYAKRRPDVLKLIVQELRKTGLKRVVEELRKTGEWIKLNPREAAEFQAPLVGLDVATAAAANAKRSYQVRSVDGPALVEQQRIADAFTAEQLLPQKLDVRENNIWKDSP